jgi:hypothetical protein
MSEMPFVSICMARFHDSLQDGKKDGWLLGANGLRAVSQTDLDRLPHSSPEVDRESTITDARGACIEAVLHLTCTTRGAKVARYFASIYQRLIDRFKEGRKLRPVNQDFLQTLLNCDGAPTVQEWMRNRVIVEKLLHLMNAETLRICRWKVQGYSDAQIATRLGLTPDAVRMRFTAGLKEAARLLHRQRS